MPPTSRQNARDLSAAVFNNDKLVEVVDALAREVPREVTAQELASHLGINHDLVKKVLNRLESAQLVKTRERIGGRRGALPYAVQDGPQWQALVVLVRTVLGGRPP